MTPTTAILLQCDQPEGQQATESILRSLAAHTEAQGRFGVELDRWVTGIAGS